MNDPQLQPMLDRLRRHYNAPVLPVSLILGAFRTWLDCLWELHTDPSLDDPEWPRYGMVYWRFAHQIADDLENSNLLHRLLVEGEPLRNEMCPVHRGRRQAEAKDCSHGCDGTGWLREAEGDRLVSYDAEDEAGRLLRLLRQRGEPAVPLRAFCGAVEIWMQGIGRLHSDPVFLEDDPRPAYGRLYRGMFWKMDIDIRKSNLLARLLYAGEELRTEKCPEHDGHWSFDPGLHSCPHHCDGTGWLRVRPTDRGFGKMRAYRLEETEEGKAGRVWDPETQEWQPHGYPFLR